jgi:transcriptional regulator with XRE-family HTH domain
MLVCMLAVMFAIGDVIRKKRTDRRWSAGVLAQKAGVSPNTLSVIERGKRSPNGVTLDKIAGAFGLSGAGQLYEELAVLSRHGSNGDSNTEQQETPTHAIPPPLSKPEIHREIYDIVRRLLAIGASLEPEAGRRFSGPEPPKTPSGEVRPGRARHRPR